MNGNRTRQEKRLALSLLAPSLAVLALLGVIPILFQLGLSFYSSGRPAPAGGGFAGLTNFGRLVGDGVFWRDLWQTCEFTVVSVSLEMVLGLGAALLLFRLRRGRAALGSVVMLPWALPTVVAAMMWSLILSDRMGLVNSLLLRAGIISEPVLWLGRGWAMPSVIMTDVWKTTPFVALILVAGLHAIPPSCYEAARMDGAGSWRLFRHISLPLLRPFLAVALIFRVMDAFRVFDLVWVLTEGAHGTETLSVYIYRFLFSYGDLGGGSAAVVTLFLLVMALSLLLLRVLRVSVRTGEA